jgi:hypothetical protein
VLQSLDLATGGVVIANEQDVASGKPAALIVVNRLRTAAYHVTLVRLLYRSGSTLPNHFVIDPGPIESRYSAQWDRLSRVRERS